MHATASVLVLSAAAFILTATQAPAQVRHFTADDLPRIVRVTDPQISPDGKTIAITVGRANMKEDRYDTEIDLIDVADHALRVMTHERLAANSARWSANGDRIAYLAQDGEKKAQVFVLPLAGGDSMQLTHSKTGVKTFAWRPDGQALAYAAEEEPVERKDEAKFEDAFEVGNNGYLVRAATMAVHLWTIAAAGSEPARRLTSGSWSLPDANGTLAGPPRIAYTPDGKSIVFQRAQSPVSGDYVSSRIEILDVATRQMHGITQAKDRESDPQISPDGTRVAYTYARDGKPLNEAALYVAPLGSTPVTGVDVAHDVDHAIEAANWMPDGKSLLIAGADGTSEAYWLQPLSGPVKRVALGALCPTTAFTVGSNGAVAFTATDATHAAELFYMAHMGDVPTQLTHLQTVTDGLTLATQETVYWKSDAFDVDGVLTYPAGYVAGQKYPLVLYLHGGPTATSLATFTPPSQIFAGHGWLVFEPNYRGSDNIGNAFQSAIVNDASVGPGRDIMAGVKAMEARGIVDSTRIAVTGWSYGGQMTAWLIGNYPTVWKAAVAGAPVTDLVDQYTLSDNNVMRGTQYGSSPFIGDKLKSYALQSPISYAWRVKTPTLIMSDVGDWRVTTTQAYKLYHALNDNGVPVKFVAFPVAGHFPADPIRSRDVWRRWTAWLDQYLGPAGGNAAANQTAP
jgi:dipeptidyl aminopeptidase/acylaminoacyl peptidase